MVNLVDELEPRELDHRLMEIIADLEALQKSVQKNFRDDQKIDKTEIQPLVDTIKLLRQRLPDGTT